jgi:mercuric ion transport protein
MEAKTAIPSRRNVLTMLTGLVAVVSCPCHLPILLLLLSGTAAGAMLEANMAMAVIWLLPIFMLSAYATWRLLGAKTDASHNQAATASRADETRHDSTRGIDPHSPFGQEK